MRAVTVPVTAMTGVGGFIFPGDRVDLVVTQEIQGEGEGDPLRASETFLRNIRVLATDQTTEKTTDENGKTVVTEFRTVTLEVTPKIAEKVAVAQSVGTISMALRALSDSESELERAIASGDVKIPANATPEQEEKLLRAAARRPTDRTGSYVTGADISRYERSTVPTKKVDPVPSAGPSFAGGPSAPVYTGPSVKVSRGKETTDTPVDAKANGGAILSGQTSGIRRVTSTVKN
jgi:pilus assembly protein CpaB